MISCEMVILGTLHSMTSLTEGILLFLHPVPEHFLLGIMIVTAFGYKGKLETQKMKEKTQKQMMTISSNLL
jgi:hypothetical protein